MRGSGQIFWFLAFEAVGSFSFRIEKWKRSLYAVSPLILNSQLSTDLAFSPPSPPAHNLRTNDWLMGSRIQLQQRNCSRFTRDFSRRSTVQTRKELPPEVAAFFSFLKHYFFGL